MPAAVAVVLLLPAVVLLAWGTELAQVHLPQGLAVAILALIAICLSA